jgi:lycopene beta-cyclase
VVGFGAAAPLVHPATGFSVATALALAPRLADAFAGPGEAHAAAGVLWSPAARAVHMLRRRGLEALLRMPPAQVPDFFELFFALPQRHRWAYLTGRDDLNGMIGTMAALFAGSGWGLRARLVGPALLPPAPARRQRAG